MTKFKMMPLVAMISAGLIGCGSSSSDGGSAPTPPKPTAPKYTWTIVELVRVTTPTAGCATFYSYENELEPSNNYSVIARMATQGYKILFHSADGSVLSEHTIEGDAISSGKVTIDSGKVPKDGYVSLEEYSGFNAGDRESYQIAFHAPLLQNMILTVRNDQPSKNSCLTGDQVSKSLDAEQSRISVMTPNSGSVVYYQTSGSRLAVAGGKEQLDIPVVSDNPVKERKIVTSFLSSELDSYERINSYLVVSADKVYKAGSEPVSAGSMALVENLFQVQLDERFSFSNDKISGLQVVLDNKIYNWQKIYAQADNQTESGYAPQDSRLRNWSANLSLVTDVNSGAWNYDVQLPLNGSDLSIEQPSSLFDFSTSSLATSGITSLDGFTPTEWTVQRTHVRTVSNSNARPIIQTIYSVPNSNQPMVASSTEVIGDTSSAKISVSLAGSNEVDKLILLNELMENSMDFETLSDPSQIINSHKYDLNGAVVSESSSLTNRLKMAGKKAEFASNSVGW
ncbi:TPA: hypothetical protein I7241_10205 [Vibrio vulnificus]|nr:hypothetical protein [Vibrio vulnificus]